MISLERAISIHGILIEEFGGTSGVRDRNALARSYATFDQKELYPTSREKAAAVIQSIVTAHPFMDGNKRLGYVLFRLILMENEMDVEASQEDKYQFVMAISKGERDYNDIVDWINEHLISNYR